MYEAALAPLVAWQNFYVIIGTVAATLTGLLFVGISVIMGARTRVSSPVDGIAAFSTPSVVHLSSALLIALLLNAPWPNLGHAALLPGLCGLG